MTTTTAADRRAKAKADYDAFLAACPTRDLLSTITGKWVSLILAALADGSRRYSQLAERVAGISPKMLTQTLRTLEAEGLVEREVTPDVPVRVDYRLTHLGETLLPLILNIKAWAEQHMPEVDEARQRFAQTPATRRE